MFSTYCVQNESGVQNEMQKIFVGKMPNSLITYTAGKQQLDFLERWFQVRLYQTP